MAMLISNCSEPDQETWDRRSGQVLGSFLEFERCVAKAREHTATICQTDDEDMHQLVTEIRLAIEEEVSDSWSDMLLCNACTHRCRKKLSQKREEIEDREARERRNMGSLTNDTRNERRKRGEEERRKMRKEKKKRRKGRKEKKRIRKMRKEKKRIWKMREKRAENMMKREERRAVSQRIAMSKRENPEERTCTLTTIYQMMMSS
jgi:hypothetical protein